MKRICRKTLQPHHLPSFDSNDASPEGKGPSPASPGADRRRSQCLPHHSIQRKTLQPDINTDPNSFASSRLLLQINCRQPFIAVSELHVYMCAYIYIHTYVYKNIYTFFFFKRRKRQNWIRRLEKNHAFQLYVIGIFCDWFQLANGGGRDGYILHLTVKIPL